MNSPEPSRPEAISYAQKIKQSSHTTWCRAAQLYPLVQIRAMLLLLILLVFAAVTTVDVWAAVAVIFGRGGGGRFCACYLVVAALVFVAAFWMTLCFSYFHNPNTQFFGWPIPRVVFQRDTPTGPWLDYIGPTIVLAYPMNFVLFMFFPSVVFLVLALRRRKRIHETVA